MKSKEKIFSVLKIIHEEMGISPDPKEIKYKLNHLVVGSGIVYGDDEEKILKKLAKEKVIDILYPFPENFKTAHNPYAQQIEEARLESIHGTIYKYEWILSINKSKLQKYLKQYQYHDTSNHSSIKNLAIIFTPELLAKIKPKDKKIAVLGEEANVCRQNNAPNACGIILRIILERALDRKDQLVKSKKGLKRKIQFCLKNNLFGKSVKGALKKLDSSTKITGDIIAHDSKIIIDDPDIELGISSLNMLLKDIFT